MYFNLIFSIILIALFSCNALADNSSFGDVATNIYEPVRLIIDLLRAVSILCGAGLIAGGFFRFMEYRRNPVQVRLSMVIFMFIFGAALIVLGFLPLTFVDKN